MIILLIFIAVSALLYLNMGDKVMLYLPIFLLLAEIVFPLVYGPSNEMSSNHIKLIFFTFLFSIFVFIRILYRAKYLANVFVFTPIVFFVIALLNSSELWEGLKQVIRISVPLFAFPAYYVYFKKTGNIQQYLKNIMLFMFLFVLLILLSSLLKVGTHWSYGERRIGGIYFFGVTLWELYSLSYAAMFLYFLKDVYRLNRIAVLVMFFAVLVILLLIYKRGLLIPMGLALLLYYMYNIKKLNAFKVIAGIVVAYIFLTPFITQILASINQREATLHLSSYAEEGRTQELSVYFYYYLNNINLYEILVGQDFFNSGGKFLIMQETIVDEYRILHSDLANLLYTTGFIGTIFFYAYLVGLFRMFLRIKKSISPLIRYLFYAFFISLILKQFVEGIDMSLNYFIPFSMLGALLGVHDRSERLVSSESEG